MPGFSTDACGTQIVIVIDAPCSTENERARNLRLALREEKRRTGAVLKMLALLWSGLAVRVNLDPRGRMIYDLLYTRR